MFHRFALCVLFIASSTHVNGQSQGLGFQAFARSIQATEKGLERVHGEVESKRSQALITEKSDIQEAKRIWAKTKTKRRKIDTRFKKLAKRLPRTSSIKPENAPQLALRLLKSWIERSDAFTVREQLLNGLGDFSKILAQQVSHKERRDLLNVISKRQSQVPGISDLDVLIEVLLWESIFFPSTTPKAKCLDTVSIDLILLFTGRGANGISKSGEKYYVASQFLADGFREDLKDKSNQVRHFCWAWRMFMKSKSPQATQSLLYLKELKDSKTRKLPMNKADLRLNKCAATVARMVKNNGSPMDIIGTAAVMRQVLGKKADTEKEPTQE